jgi:hypothetical protein
MPVRNRVRPVLVVLVAALMLPAWTATAHAAVTCGGTGPNVRALTPATAPLSAGQSGRLSAVWTADRGVSDWSTTVTAPADLKVTCPTTRGGGDTSLYGNSILVGGTKDVTAFRLNDAHPARLASGRVVRLRRSPDVRPPPTRAYRSCRGRCARARRPGSGSRRRTGRRTAPGKRGRALHSGTARWTSNLLSELGKSGDQPFEAHDPEVVTGLDQVGHDRKGGAVPAVVPDAAGNGRARAGPGAAGFPSR